MANKIPLKAIYSGSNTSALSELQSGDTIAVSYIDGLQAGLDAKVPLAGGTMTGNLNFGDNNKVQVGASQDGYLTHDGSHTILVDNGTGNLTLKSNGAGINFQKGDSETLASFSTDGTCTLRFDNTARISTTSSGIDVTGTTQTDSLTVQGAITEQETTKTASFTPSLTTDGTIFDVSGTITVTMPAATAGKSFTIIDSGSGTLSWSGTIKWPSATAPVPSGSTIYSFVSNGTNWYGMMAGTGFA
jgi:hypothetical protein